MLKLKEPILLKSARSLLSLSDSFSQRILGNYALLGAQISPKELLFALNTPAELPEELGSMTTIAVQNNLSDNRTVIMDIVNHVVNRILLSQTPSFTYQDKVYIETVLHKLGIHDVQLFLSQVAELQQEETHIHALLQLYQQELAQGKPLKPIASQSLSQQKKVERSAVTESSSALTPLSLHQEIYRRLSTASIYQTMASYFSSISSISPIAEHRFLQMAEQNWSSSLLELEQQYQSRYQQQDLTFLQTVNRYETQGFPEFPEKEDQVLSQAAAAVLFSSVGHVLTQRLSQNLHSHAIWQDLSQSLSETVENTLNRFEDSYAGNLFSEYFYREGDVFPLRFSQQQSLTLDYRTQEPIEGDKDESARISSTLTKLVPDAVPKQQEFLPADTTPAIVESSSEPQETILLRELREIDLRNREKQQKLRLAHMTSQLNQARQPVPDQKRTMADALKSIDMPEQVLRQVLENALAPMQHLNLSPEAEFLLSQTDDATKQVLRAALLHEENPQAVEGTGEIRPGNIAQLNLENRVLTQHSEEQVDSVLSERHHIQEYNETKENFLEEIRQAKGSTTLSHNQEVSRTPVRFIHKQEAQTFTEEFLEQLQLQRQEQKTVQTDSTVSTVERRNVQQNDITAVNHRTVVQTTEDITALVNRTLSKQMNIISQKVYQQMEKRLQAERFRRGKF